MLAGTRPSRGGREAGGEQAAGAQVRHPRASCCASPHLKGKVDLGTDGVVYFGTAASDGSRRPPKARPARVGVAFIMPRISHAMRAADARSCSSVNPARGSREETARCSRRQASRAAEYARTRCRKASIVAIQSGKTLMRTVDGASLKAVDVGVAGNAAVARLNKNGEGYCLIAPQRVLRPSTTR